MGCIVSVKNSTDSTPEIIVAQLAGCHWLPGFSLAAPVSIRPWGQKVGWVDGGFDYQIDLTTRFYLYSENVMTRITVRGGDQVEVQSRHSAHILNDAFWRREDGEIVVYIEYETWSRTHERHPLPTVGGDVGGKGKVIVRAGTVASLINTIEGQPDHRAHQISVNQSTKTYPSLDAALNDLTSTGGPFSTSRYVAAGWKVDIEKKRGTFRDDPLRDNEYHALMDNLPAKEVGGVFQQKRNPHGPADDQAMAQEEEQELA